MLNFIDFNFLSVTAGALAVILTAVFRANYPFRYQYTCLFFKRNPKKLRKILQKSYHNNRNQLVGWLDKSSKEILESNYDEAEHYIVKALERIKKNPKGFNDLLSQFFYYNLAVTRFYRNRYRDALQLSLQAYENNPGLKNALALSICCMARLGNISHAERTWEKLKNESKIKLHVALPCLAEIEIAKGNVQRGIHLLEKASKHANYTSSHMMKHQLDARLLELRHSFQLHNQNT